VPCPADDRQTRASGSRLAVYKNSCRRVVFVTMVSKPGKTLALSGRPIATSRRETVFRRRPASCRTVAERHHLRPGVPPNPFVTCDPACALWYVQDSNCNLDIMVNVSKTLTCRELRIHSYFSRWLRQSTIRQRPNRCLGDQQKSVAQKMPRHVEEASAA